MTPDPKQIDQRVEAIDGGPLPPNVPFFNDAGDGVAFAYVAHLRQLLGLRPGQSLAAALGKGCEAAKRAGYDEALRDVARGLVEISKAGP